MTSDGGIINIKAGGTLDMYNTRWTMGPYNQINLYENAVLTGDGDGYGAIDMNTADPASDVAIHAYGNATIEAPISSRRHNKGVITVDAGKTLIATNRLATVAMTKKGAGTLKLTYPLGTTGSNTSLPGRLLLHGRKSDAVLLRELLQAQAAFEIVSLYLRPVWFTRGHIITLRTVERLPYAPRHKYHTW